MKLRLLIIFALLGAFYFSSCAYYNTFYNAKKFYRSASKARKERLRTQVVELSPEEQARLKRRGQLQSRASRPSSKEMQDYQRAIEKAYKVLEFYPKSKYVDDALILLGECFYYRREFSKAQRKFEELIELYPESEFIPRARLFMAKTLLGLRKFDEAEQMFREITLDDKFDKELREEAAYELAGLYYEKEEYELAAEEYRVTSKKSGDKLIKAMSLYRLGECLLKLGKYEEAPKIFKRAVKASPNEDFKSQATFKLGEAQSLNGNYKAAIRTFSDLLSKEFERKRIPRIKLQLAENLRKNGDLEEAIKWYNAIIEEHKRTDASARSYFALGEIEEFINGNYKKAKENYDMVRGEFANSAIAPEAKRRADNIKALLDLRNEIAKLEGREVASDSTASDDKKKGDKEQREQKDDAPIDLTMDGFWVNYAGRDRPPPLTLQDLTERDLERAALSRNKLQAAGALDSTKAAGAIQSVELDSAALAQKAEEEKKQKLVQLAEKRLALAELLLFSFNKPDSAADLYLQIIESKTDTALSSKALYSLGYIFRSIKHDTAISDTIFQKLVTLYPESPQANGARKILGLPIVGDRVDSAEIIYEQAEQAFWDNDDLDTALGLYETIIESYPDSPYAPKAEYALGWLYENRLYEYDLAAEHYQNIIKNHPDSPFAKQIKRKLDAVERVRKQEEARQKAIADSLAKVKQDSLAAIAKDSVQTKQEAQAPVASPDVSAPGKPPGAAQKAAAGATDSSGVQKARKDSTLAKSPAPAAKSSQPDSNKGKPPKAPPQAAKKDSSKGGPEKKLPGKQKNVVKDSSRAPVPKEPVPSPEKSPSTPDSGGGE